MTSILRRLSRAAVRYGVQPEHLGPVSVFTDDLYMAEYLKSMRGWGPPSHYGGTPKDRQVARQRWAKVIAKVESAATKTGNNKPPRARKSAAQTKAQRRARVGEPRPILGEQPAYQEPEDGFDMAVLAPKETGLPFYVFILEDMGVVPDVRVEVAHSARGSRAETVKVAIRPTVRVTSGHLGMHELELLTRWIDLNRDVLIRYWSHEIESTIDAIRALRPIENP